MIGEWKPGGGSLGLGGIFRFVARRIFRRTDDADLAIPVLVDKVSCPYCGSFYTVITLGRLTWRLDKRVYLTYEGRRVPNPAFRGTHLANPIRCPNCGRKYYVFVGVEYDRKMGVRQIDVKPIPEDEKSIEKLIDWPHKGLVMKEAIHYTPFKAYLYESLDDLIESLSDEIEVGAASLPGSHALQATETPRESRPRPKPMMINLDE